MESAELQISTSLNNLAVSTAVSIKSIDKNTIIEAHNIGTTGGKLDLAEEYVQVTGDKSQVKDIVDMPVNELEEAIEKANSDNQGKAPQYDKDNDKKSNDDKDDKDDEKSDKHNKDDDDLDDIENEDNIKDNPSENRDERADEAQDKLDESNTDDDDDDGEDDDDDD